MNKFFSTKLFIAVIFFCIGFLTNHLLTKITRVPTVVSSTEERFPVNPDDFDHQRMLDTIARMTEEGDSEMNVHSALGSISQYEDEKNVYYEIPLMSEDGTNHKLNVEIKNGMIKISEDIKAEGNDLLQTSSARAFSIDPSLDGDQATVKNEKDKIVIRIPKK